MTKSKKKKNYKLRRRVKRTVAALTMIMAIVVAAIPVENYGTMQASGVDGESISQTTHHHISRTVISIMRHLHRKALMMELKLRHSILRVILSSMPLRLS